MKTSILAAAIVAFSAFAAHAETNSLSGKAMHDLLAADRGVTVNPTAKFFSGSISDKVQMDLAAVRGGRTTDPLARPVDFSLSSKAALR